MQYLDSYHNCNIWIHITTYLLLPDSGCFTSTYSVEGILLVLAPIRFSKKSNQLLVKG